MTDRVGVMNAGQDRTDRHAGRGVRNCPPTVFVADFLGISNLMDAGGRSAPATAAARSRSATSG